mgnify:CR=1 FL=1
MSNSNSKTNETNDYQPAVTRRALLRTAAVGTGAATVGTVGISTQTQQTSAGVFDTISGLGPVTVAGIVTGFLFGGDGEKPTAEEVNQTAVTQSTWEISTSVSKGRETLVEELSHEYGIGTDGNALSTSHGSAMWSAVETSVARSRVDGDPGSVAVEDARADLNKYAATSIWNNIDRWNSFWAAMSSAVAKSISGEGVVTPSNGSFTALKDSSQTAIDPAATEPLVEIDGSTYVWTDPLDGSNVDLPSWLDLADVAGENNDVSTSELQHGTSLMVRSSTSSTRRQLQSSKRHTPITVR